MTRTGSLVAVLLLACSAGGAAAERVTIIANPGPFGSIAEAAAAERRARFDDADPADDAACTECFAALELRHFLAACTGVNEADFELSPPNRLPPEGRVFILGSRRSNPLIGELDPAGDNRLKPSATES